MLRFPTQSPALRYASCGLLPLLAAMLVGASLRLMHIESRELEYDEGATAYFAALRWSDLWGARARLETNPPLFTSLAWMLHQCGATAEQLRYISVFVSIASIPAAWSVANALAGRFAATSAAWLLATSVQSVILAQYARAYALLTLCLLLAWRCLLGASQTQADSPNRAWWAGYITAGTAAVYTHYCALAALLSLSAAVLWSAPIIGMSLRRFVATTTAANLAIAACYAPWLPVLIYQVQHSGGHGSAAATHLALWRNLYRIISDKYAFQGRAWFDPGVLPFVLCCAWRSRLPGLCAQCLALACLGPLALALASEFHPLLNGKTLSWAYAFMLICAGVGCSALGGFRTATLVLLSGLQLHAALTSETREAEGWRQMAALLRTNAQPGDVLYVSSAASILLLRHYSYPEAMLHVAAVASPIEEPWFLDAPLLTFVPLASMPCRIAGGPRIWLLTRHQPSLLAPLVPRTFVEQLYYRTPSLEVALFTRSGQ
jgi:hypothetical protein